MKWKLLKTPFKLVPKPRANNALAIFFRGKNLWIRKKVLKYTVAAIIVSNGQRYSARVLRDHTV